MVEAAAFLMRWQFYVVEVPEAEIRDLPRGLRDVVLQLLNSFRFELAVLVQCIVGGKLYSHVVKVVLCEVSKAMRYRFEARRLWRRIRDLHISSSHYLGELQQRWVR